MRGFVQIIIIIVIFLVIGIIIGYTLSQGVSLNNLSFSNKQEASISAKLDLSSESTAPAAPVVNVKLQAVKSTQHPFPTVTSSAPTALPTTSSLPNYSPPTQSSVHIDSIAPTSGKVGDEFVIKGSGFGKSSFYYPDPTKFKGGVSFYGPAGYNSGGAPQACTRDWDYSCWTETELRFKVPGVAAGYTFQIEVMSADGERSNNRVSFTVIE